MERTNKSKNEYLDVAGKLINEYNLQVLCGNSAYAKNMKPDIEQAVNEYTYFTRHECLQELLKADDPMVAAVKRLTFSTVKTKSTYDSYSGKSTYELVERKVIINLRWLHEVSKYGIGHDKKWFSMVGKLCILLSAQKSIYLGINPLQKNDSQIMQRIVNDIEAGGTPTSKTKILHELQNVVSAMIGEEYKVTSHDVCYLLCMYAYNGRNGSGSSYEEQDNVCRYLTEICHHLIEGVPYKNVYSGKAR